MTTVVYIRHGNGKNTMTVGLSEEEKSVPYIIPLSLYFELGEPTAGTSLSEDITAKIREADQRRRAQETALRLLAFGDNSRRQLCRKLVARGFTREQAVAAADEAVSMGYLDENRQLRRLTEIAANEKLWGAKRILADLTAKGYDRREILRSIDACVTDGRVNFQENFHRLLQKKHVDPDDTMSVCKLRFTFGYVSTDD